MNIAHCGDVREFIPDFVGNRLGAEECASIEAHIEECAECREEVELTRSIYATRAAIPDGLATRVMENVRRERRAPRRPWWGLSAAAVAALALGIGITSEPDGQSDLESPDFVYEVGDQGIWLSDDGLLAGAPSFDGLTDEALLQLLDELSAGSTGGVA